MTNLVIPPRGGVPSAMEEFERLYRDNVSAISAFFERRTQRIGHRHELRLDDPGRNRDDTLSAAV